MQTVFQSRVRIFRFVFAVIAKQANVREIGRYDGSCPALIPVGKQFLYRAQRHAIAYYFRRLHAKIVYHQALAILKAFVPFGVMYGQSYYFRRHNESRIPVPFVTWNQTTVYEFGKNPVYCM